MIGTRQMDFGGLDIAFDSRVLSPRPWTQLQSRWAAELLPELPPGDVLELCAGVGHIGLLAVAGSGRRLVQVDASEAACDFAIVNAARAAVSTEVRRGALDEVLAPDERFALVIADPPWVRSAEVSRHREDPPSAIDGGADGLTVVRSCLAVIAQHLAVGGAALLQVGGRDQVASVTAHVAGQQPPALRVEDHRLVDGGALVLLGRR